MFLTHYMKHFYHCGMLWDIQLCDKVHGNTLFKYNKSASKAGWVMYANPEYIYLQKNEKIKRNKMNFQR